jgi:voltage-gated potassium channel Kch
LIARSFLAGPWKETYRLNMIDDPRDHIIVSGYGRVGRRAAGEREALAT